MKRHGEENSVAHISGTARRSIKLATLHLCVFLFYAITTTSYRLCILGVKDGNSKNIMYALLSNVVNLNGILSALVFLGKNTRFRATLRNMFRNNRRNRVRTQQPAVRRIMVIEARDAVIQMNKTH